MRHRNKPGGYWIAEFDPTAAYHAITGSVPIEGETTVLAVSDGMERLVSVFGAYPSMPALASDIRTMADADRVVNKLRRLERDKANFKKDTASISDDASLFLITV